MLVFLRGWRLSYNRGRTRCELSSLGLRLSWKWPSHDAIFCSSEDTFKVLCVCISWLSLKYHTQTAALQENKLKIALRRTYDTCRSSWFSSLGCSVLSLAYIASLFLLEHSLPRNILTLAFFAGAWFRFVFKRTGSSWSDKRSAYKSTTKGRKSIQIESALAALFALQLCFFIHVEPN